MACQDRNRAYSDNTPPLADQAGLATLRSIFSSSVLTFSTLPRTRAL
jgi:hypothetical protein